MSLGEAVPALRGSSFASAGLCLAATELYLAIAYKRLGREDDARESLAAATQTFEKFPSPNNSLWNDWMNVKVVLAEAQAIVLGKSE